MIPQSTVAEILSATDIIEVISDHVDLKKRGVNYIGLCPFHQEKTPSFTVSPSKEIFKCFGCGVAGNAVKFLMEKEHYNYVETLRYLAGKYNIEIEEKEATDEEKEAQKEQDSLFILNNFARDHFVKQLHETGEGKSIGLSYFKERGFSEEVIKAFELGYAGSGGDNLAKEALERRYKRELLIKLNLVKSYSSDLKDFFRERVMFPIHNVSGKVIAFGGRTLSKDKKIPKYINSPESEIYNKRKIVYGIYHAKKAIREHDLCYLVEGYTDVLSLFQSGMKNVVASSGTSLTQEQTRLIKRYSHNIVLLYDGDEAGVKAAIRGMGLMLEEGMNVKVVLLPDEEDPDSFVRKEGKQGMQAYIEKNAKDMVLLQADLLMDEAEGDPVKKTELIKDMVKTVSNIPDPVKRALYIKECSEKFHVAEQLLITEANKIIRNKLRKDKKMDEEEKQVLDKKEQEKLKEIHEQPKQEPVFSWQEADIIRLLVEYGSKQLDEEKTVAEYITEELHNIPFQNKLHQQILNEVNAGLEKNEIPGTHHFLNHADEKVSKYITDLIFSPYELSPKWEAYGIYTKDKAENFQRDVQSGLGRFKFIHLLKLINQNSREMKNTKEEEKLNELLAMHQYLLKMKKELAEKLGTVIIR